MGDTDCDPGPLGSPSALCQNPGPDFLTRMDPGRDEEQEKPRRIAFGKALAVAARGGAGVRSPRLSDLWETMRHSSPTEAGPTRLKLAITAVELQLYTVVCSLPPPKKKMRTIAETVNLAKTSMPRIPPTPPSHTHRPRDRVPVRASQVYGPPPAAASGRRLWREEQEERVRLGGGRGEIQSNAFESSWGCPVFF